MEFKDVMRELREKHNMSQKIFAESIGVPQSSYGHMECGRNEPTKETLNAVIARFELSHDHFDGCEFVRKEKYKGRAKRAQKVVEGQSNIVIHHTERKDYKMLNELLQTYRKKSEDILHNIEKMEVEYSYLTDFIKDIEKVIYGKKVVEKVVNIND